MIKQLLICVLLIIGKYSSSQVIIEGKISGSLEKQQLFYFKPLNGYKNIFYDLKKIILINKDSFHENVPATEPCFINIKLPDANGIVNLFVSPGDTISLKADFKKIAGKVVLQSLKFGGSNAAGHELYSNTKHLFGQQYILKNIFPVKRFSTINDFTDNCFITFDTIIQKFDLLKKNGKISQSFARHTALDLVGSALVHVIPFYRAFLLIDSTSGRQASLTYLQQHYLLNKHLYSQEKLDSVKVSIYNRYDPLDPALITSGLGLLYVQSYLKDIQEGLIKTNKSYDSTFLSLCQDCRSYGYVRGQLQEYLWAKSLHWEPLVDADVSNLKRNINTFEEYFPNSILLPYLKEIYSTALSNQIKENQAGEILFLNTTFKTLGSLIATDFKNRYVFVDLWATWCTPCIQDFLFKDKVDSLLNGKNISKLYISIDKRTDEKKWKDLIMYKKLYGHHFLASDQFISNIKRSIYKNETVAIPRYLLIDPMGKILSMDLARPSDFVNFVKEINRLTPKNGFKN